MEANKWSIKSMYIKKKKRRASKRTQKSKPQYWRSFVFTRKQDQKSSPAKVARRIDTAPANFYPIFGGLANVNFKPWWHDMWHWHELQWTGVACVGA